MIKKGFAIHRHDAHFLTRGDYSAVYSLIAPSGEAAIFDTGTPAGYPRVKAELTAAGITPDNLTKIFVSHAHLDHSGSASLLAKDFPNAVIFAHPETVDPLHAPNVLMQQTKAILKSTFDDEYGDHVLSIPRRRMVTTRDGMEIDVAGAGRLKIFHTEGHAKHHLSLFDSSSRTMFTGDSMGSCYRLIDEKKVFASTPPPTFDPDMMISSVKKMMNAGVARLALAHFDFVDDVERHANRCISWIERMKRIAQDGNDKVKVKDAVRHAFEELYGDNLALHWDHLKLDVLVNSLGVNAYARRLQAEATAKKMTK